MKRLISALIVFTLVLTCAMSAVNAANFSTTTTYKANGDVEVTTVASGTDIADAMVAYVICDGDTPTDSNIKYIDQKTANASGEVEFTVTDEVAKLDGKKIVMGASAGSVAAEFDADATVNTGKTDALLLTVDAVEGVVGESITVFVSQVGSNAKTGVNIYVTKNDDTVVEFKNLYNLSGENDYAIQLVDESEEGVLADIKSIDVKPIVGGVEMTKISGNYWVQ